MKLFKSAILALAVLILTVPAFADTQRLGGTSVSFSPTKIVTKTASTYTLTTSDSQVNGDCTSNAITFTLPAISSITSGTKAYKIKKTDSTGNKITVTAASGNTIGGEASRVITQQNDYIVIESQGTDWRVTYESPYVVENHLAGTLNFTGIDSTQLTSDTSMVGTTPTLTMGDAGAEDTQINFDGNAVDFSIGLDDSADKLVLSKDTALGTTNIFAISNTPTAITLHDASAADATLVYDGNAQDFYMCLDDSADDLVFGLGSTCGTTPAFAIDENQVTTWTGGTIKLAEITTGTDVLTASQCGSTIFLNSATEYQTTLPALSTTAAGCEFTFIVKAAAAAANYTIITGNTTENKIYGSMEVAGAVVACADEDTITLVDGNAVGDWVRVMSDGTNWYLSGSTVTSAKATCTQAS